MVKKSLKSSSEFQSPYYQVYCKLFKREDKFLNVEVIKNENQLVTDLYLKPTDIHQYLQASSCHVFHSKKSMPRLKAKRDLFKKFIFR